ncbi:MAG: hypothetical protein HQK76_18635 [Desulfobacterales bacterium]|nr:hypothetical protein [Desulfobacterales bacterium]
MKFIHKKVFVIIGILILCLYGLSNAEKMGMPSTEELQEMSYTLVDGILKQLNKSENKEEFQFPLKNVVVIFPFLERGMKTLDKPNSDKYFIGNSATKALLEELVAHPDKFQARKSALTRYDDKISKELHSSLLLSNDNLEAASHELGAEWFVDGEFFCEGGKFYIHAGLVQVQRDKTGRIAALKTVSNTWFERKQCYIFKIIWAIVFISVAVLIGIVVFLFNKKALINQINSELKTAVSQRDISKITQIVAEDKINKFEPILFEAALNLLAKINGIIIEGVPSYKVIIAPGPIQGMGRGDKWIFSFRDTRISRAPHIWIKADNGTFLMFVNKNIKGIFVNKEEKTSVFLKNGDVVAIDENNEFKVSISDDNAWIAFDIVKGPESGSKMILVNAKVDIGGDNNHAIILPSLDKNSGYISWKDGRPFLYSNLSDVIADFEYSTDKGVLLLNNDELNLGNYKLKITALRNEN